MLVFDGSTIGDVAASPEPPRFSDRDAPPRATEEDPLAQTTVSTRVSAPALPRGALQLSAYSQHRATRFGDNTICCGTEMTIGAGQGARAAPTHNDQIDSGGGGHFENALRRCPEFHPAVLLDRHTGSYGKHLPQSLNKELFKSRDDLRVFGDIRNYVNRDQAGSELARQRNGAIHGVHTVDREVGRKQNISGLALRRDLIALRSHGQNWPLTRPKSPSQIRRSQTRFHQPQEDFAYRLPWT